LELQYAAMMRKQRHEKEEVEGRRTPVGERKYATAPLGLEAPGISGQPNCQHDGTEEVSDQVHNREEMTFSGHKAILYFKCCFILCCI
jgi:hypothetical protein